MECKTSSEKSDSAPGPLSDSKMAPDRSYSLQQEKAEPHLDLVEPEAVKMETFGVKEELVDEDEDEKSHGASQIFPVETVKELPSAQTSQVWPEIRSQADSVTGSCPSYGDPTSDTSYPLKEPSIHPLKEERLFTYEKTAEVEEHDPLADQSAGSPPEGGVILNDEKPSLDPLVIEIPKTATNTMGEHLLEELKALGIKRLNFSSLTNPEAAKLPDRNPSEGVKSYICVEPPNSYREVPVHEPGMSSIQSHSDATESESRRLQRITQERLGGLMAGVVTLPAMPPTSYVPPKIRVSCAAKKKKVGKKSKACQTTLNTQEKEFYTRMFAPPVNCPTLFYDPHQLDSRTKSIVYNVAYYFQEKKKKFSLSYNVADVASGVTNLPKTTVRSIISIGRRSLEDDKTLRHPTFGRYHTEKCKNCGDVLVDFALREIIFNGYVEERKALTIKEISTNLDDEELYVCEDFLRRRLRELGIDLMRCIATSGYIPLERPELTASRYRYFQNIEKHRILHKQIVYVFEVDLSKVCHGKVTWEPLEGHPTKDDSHLMTVIHAARESCFIDGSLFVHSNTARQHRKSMHPLTLFWLNSFLPKLTSGSVVVLGHNRHHFVGPAAPKPDASWPKQEIVEWLHDHQQESFSSSLPSAVLLEKVNTIDVGSKFGIDDLVKSYGHIPLHLPQNHRELNPVELVWRKILEKFPSIDIESEGPMRDFLQKEFDSISPSELQEAFELSENHEKRLRHLDMRIDEPVGEVIRRVGGILGRNYALAEDESGDDDSSTDQVRNESLGKVTVGSSEASKKKFQNNETSLVQPGKKRKIADCSQAVIGTKEPIPQPMLHISPSSKKDSQEGSTGDGRDNSQVRESGGTLRTTDDTSLVQQLREGRTSPTAVGCIAGSYYRKAQPVPRSSSPSWNASEGTSAQGSYASANLLETSGGKQVDQPESDISGSLFAADSDAADIPTESETTETASEDSAGAGRARFRSPSDWANECVADVCDITLRNPIKEESYEDMFWESTRESLTPWSEELTESVTVPPLLNPEDNRRITINGNSDEQNPGLVAKTGKEKENPYLENMEVKDTETSTPHTDKSKKSASTDDPLDSELFKDLKNLIARQPLTFQNSDILKEYVRLEQQRQQRI